MDEFDDDLVVDDSIFYKHDETIDEPTKDDKEIRKKRREERQKKREKEREDYFKQYPGQDFSEYGDCWDHTSIEKDKYYIENPKQLFSEYKSEKWRHHTFYYVYMFKNKKYVRFLSSILVSGYDYIIRYWSQFDCCEEIQELHKFGIERNVGKMLVHENIFNDVLCDDPYDALNHANGYLHLGAKEKWVHELAEDTPSGYYYDPMIQQF